MAGQFWDHKAMSLLTECCFYVASAVLQILALRADG